MDPKVPRRAPVQLELHGLTWRPRMPRRAGRTRQCGVERYSTPHCCVRPRCGGALSCAWSAPRSFLVLLWGSRAAAGSWALRLCGSGDGVGTRARQARVLLDGTRRDAIDRWFHHHLNLILVFILPPYPFSARAPPRQPAHRQTDSVSVSVCLRVCLSVCLSVGLSVCVVRPQ